MPESGMSGTLRKDAAATDRPACFACERDPYTGQRIPLDRCRTCDAAVPCALMRSARAQEVIAANADDRLRERRDSRQARQPYARR